MTCVIATPVAHCWATKSWWLRSSFEPPESPRLRISSRVANTGFLTRRRHARFTDDRHVHCQRRRRRTQVRRSRRYSVGKAVAGDDTEVYQFARSTSPLVAAIEGIKKFPFYWDCSTRRIK